MYTTVWKLRGDNLPALQGLQIGLPGTWIIPDNRDFCLALCPAGTRAHEWKERAPYYRDVFQTIEGGAGFWCSTRFPSSYPKYRINGTPDGYNTEISSPLFGFGAMEGLKQEQLGLLQISNRIVVPPDGITFKKFTDNRHAVQVGSLWAALPLMDPYTREDGTPIGNNTWTLFLNTSNFKGPVVSWLPDVWAKLSQKHTGIRSRGWDTRPALSGSIAMEINSVPYFQDGNMVRIPKLAFPTSKPNVSVLFSHVRALTADALFNPFRKWVSSDTDNSGDATRLCLNPSGVFKRSATVQPFQLKVGPKDLCGRCDNSVSTQVDAKDDAFQLKWKTTSKREPFLWLRSDYKLINGQAKPLNSDACSANLKSAVFRAARARTSGVYCSSLVFGDESKDCETGKLSDGSTVSYRWVRFVDQPTFAQKKWSAGEKERIQNTIERLHRTMECGNESFNPPFSEPCEFPLGALDNALFVVPPCGKKYGYVPIAVGQKRCN